MKYHIRWKDLAIDDLTAIWLSATSSERRVIASAAKETDRLLESRPDLAGESRDDDRRIIFVAPLAITFRVDVASAEAQILRVRKFS